MIEIKQWQWPYKCEKCKAIIYSKIDGQFASCLCGGFVDQTPYYMRMGGYNLRPLTKEELKENNFNIQELN